MTDIEKQEKRQQIVAEVKSWILTPFHHQGRVKGAGVDCGMLILEVFERVGLTPHIIPDYYPPDFMMHRQEEWYLATMASWGVEILEPPYLPGDGFVVRHGRIYSHGGIIIDYPNVIHANSLEKCVCYGKLTDPMFEGRTPRIFRHKELL